ncbi:MAG TPA: hypothetical protein EYQ26_14455 [Rhodospirillales bacterium]|nr:hypothetical protein [Rhodospirillales bacterium]
MAIPTPSSTTAAGSGFIKETMAPAIAPIKAAGSALGNPLQTLNAPPVVMAAAAAMGTMFGADTDKPDKKLKKAGADLTESSDALDISAESLGKDLSESSDELDKSAEGLAALGSMLGLENIEIVLRDIRDSIFAVERAVEKTQEWLGKIFKQTREGVDGKKIGGAPGERGAPQGQMKIDNKFAGFRKAREKVDPTAKLRAIEEKREAARDDKKKAKPTGKSPLAKGLMKIPGAESLMTTLAGISIVISKISGFFVALWTGIKAIGRFTKKFGGQLLKIVKFIKVIPGIGWIILAIEALYLAITGFIEGWKADGFMGAMKGALTNMIDGIIDWPLNFVKDVFSWVLDLFGNEDASAWLDSWEFDFSGWIGEIFDKIGATLLWPFEAVGDFIDGFKEDGLMGGVFSMIEGLWDNLIDTPLNLIKDLISGILGLFGNEDASAWLDSWEFDLSGMLGSIFDWMLDIPDKIKAWAGGAISALGVPDWLNPFVGGDEPTEAKAEKEKDAKYEHMKQRSVPKGTSDNEYTDDETGLTFIDSDDYDMAMEGWELKQKDAQIEAKGGTTGTFEQDKLVSVDGKAVPELSELDQALIDGDDEKAIELNPRLKKRSIRSAARRKATMKDKIGASSEKTVAQPASAPADVGPETLKYIQKVYGQPKITKTDLDKMIKLGMVTISPNGSIKSRMTKIRGGAYLLSSKTAAKFSSKWSGIDVLMGPATKWLNQNADFVYTGAGSAYIQGAADPDDLDFSGEPEQKPKDTQKQKPIPVKKAEASGLTGAATDDKSWFKSGSDWIKSLIGGPKEKGIDDVDAGGEELTKFQLNKKEKNKRLRAIPGMDKMTELEQALLINDRDKITELSPELDINPAELSKKRRIAEIKFRTITGGGIATAKGNVARDMHAEKEMTDLTPQKQPPINATLKEGALQSSERTAAAGSGVGTIIAPSNVTNTSVSQSSGQTVVSAPVSATRGDGSLEGQALQPA